MLSNRARLALTDIRDNIRLAEQFAAGLSVEALKTDRRTFYAVTRCLEIISEAARRLPQRPAPRILPCRRVAVCRLSGRPSVRRRPRTPVEPTASYPFYLRDGASCRNKNLRAVSLGVAAVLSSGGGRAR